MVHSQQRISTQFKPPEEPHSPMLSYSGIGSVLLVLWVNLIGCL